MIRLDLDVRNRNGARIGTQPELNGGVAATIETIAAVLPAAHAVGVPGFGIVTIHSDRSQYGWLDASGGDDGGPVFRSGDVDDLSNAMHATWAMLS